MQIGVRLSILRHVQADDPPETTTIFEEGVNSSLLKLQEKRTVESKSAKDARGLKSSLPLLR